MVGSCFEIQQMLDMSWLCLRKNQQNEGYPNKYDLMVTHDIPWLINPWSSFGIPPLLINHGLINHGLTWHWFTALRMTIWPSIFSRTISTIIQIALGSGRDLNHQCCRWSRQSGWSTADLVVGKFNTYMQLCLFIFLNTSLRKICFESPYMYSIYIYIHPWDNVKTFCLEGYNHPFVAQTSTQP